MKYADGTKLQNDDLVIMYPRRILKKDSYEIWQHPYFDNEVLYDDFDLQLVVFKENVVKSFHVSEKEERLKDRQHLAKLQTVYHDITLNFEENTYKVEDIFSDKVDQYFNMILKKENIL